MADTRGQSHSSPPVNRGTLVPDTFVNPLSQILLPRRYPESVGVAFFVFLR